MRSKAFIGGLALSLGAATGAWAQALPRIQALYPPGARAGSTLDVAIRGGGIEGAREVIVDGTGLKATLNAANVKIDPAEQKLFQGKCAGCHELRGPQNISRTADQWVATVDRMIKDKGAPIDDTDRAKIVNYVRAAARASAGLTARIEVAADAKPGPREIRIVGTNGTSTAFPFEVTTQPESLEAEPNNDVTKAPVVSLPLTVSGQLTNTDVDAFAFQAKKGERLVFNCSAYRLNEASQDSFFPVLFLYDDKGKELVKNTGYFSFDPLIDWTAPADGKYVILIRDMLYRGTPKSIYRLSMGALPYKTYLFPAGGKRGTTTRTTLSGENMQPKTLEVPVAANAPAGVRQVSTAQGAFRFVAGEYEEYIEKDVEGPQAIQLPLSINGRIQAEKEEDRYKFTLTKETLGTYTFEAFADRVGSPLVARLTLRDPKGRALVSNNGGAGTRDPRIDYNFTQPGEYTLEILDAAERFSPAHIYRISAGPADPDFHLEVFPDNPNLGPGSSVYLTVRVPRRVGVPGDIEVQFSKLPAGVTASPTVIRAGENQAFVTLTAAPNAKVGTFSLAEVTGKTTINGKTIQRDAVPYEIYRINNNAQVSYRANMVVSVGPDAGWKVSLSPVQMRMSPQSGPVEVTVKLDRNGYDRDLPFAIVGVPNGVRAPRSILFKRGTDEMTFTLTPTDGGIFAPRRANQPPPPPYFLLAVVNGREGEGMMMCSPAVPVHLSMPEAAP